MRTCALIGRNGSLDWLCLPRFDSPSVFAAILDSRQGGHFSIQPCEPATVKQFYWPDTNVLVTRFLSEAGVAELYDFTPVGDRVPVYSRDLLMRTLKVVRGTVSFRVECYPAFDYARVPHTTTLVREGAIFHTPALTLRLETAVPLQRDDRGVSAELVLKGGEHTSFALSPIRPDLVSLPTSCERSIDLFEATIEYWRRWLSQCTYRGRWREMVHRSALALKLLTYEPTGAIVAAPTCSLPEGIGGGRNWDYRYTWLRDAAFTVYGFLRIGFSDEAARFMEWLEERCCQAGDERLQIVYGIDGRKELPESVLPHLEGYRGSRPVRIGNGAASQLQLDIYGELMDAVYLYNKYGAPISSDLWRHLRQRLDWLCDNWDQEDEGIWEFRSGRRNFVYSRLMCWVAFDRGLRLAQKRSFPANHLRWLATRDAIYEQLMTRGWSAKLQAFVQHYGSESLDASNLIMPLVFFLSPRDPKMLRTLEAIDRTPEEGGLVHDGLVHRYSSREDDGVRGSEGTFNMCTFWLVEALTRAATRDRARQDKARLLFERMLGYANHLGLYAEETGPSGEALGNFPQAFTHLALISAAFNLDRMLDERRRGAA
ncbi:MAG: glycoside hydrolase family 15 protein [Planctomycetota bacterium]